MRDLVATINGSTLFVLNRYTGDILYQTTIDGAPGGGPGLSNKRAYVPMVTGMILAYRLEPVVDAAKELGKLNVHAPDMTDEEKKEQAKKDEEERRENIRIRQEYVPPLACSSTGRGLVPPLVTTQNRDEEYVTWVTDRGYLYVGRVDRRSADKFVATYRLGTKGTFSNPPAYLPPDPKVLGDSGIVFAGSSDGYVYAVLERSGEFQWKFAASEPVIDSPVVIENRVYVTTELGGMFCLNAKTGKQIWWAPDLLHFVAAGKRRVYAADKLDRLRIIDARTGATLDNMPTSTLPIKISNGQTDRIYLDPKMAPSNVCASWTSPRWLSTTKAASRCPTRSCPRRRPNPSPSPSTAARPRVCVKISCTNIISVAIGCSSSRHGIHVV